MRRVIAITTLLASALAPQAVMAQRWFQVEMVVFAQPDGANAEQWAPTPALAYPEASRFLLDPQRLGRAIAEHPGTAHLDTLGRVFISPESATPPDITREDENRDATGTADAAVPTPFRVFPSSYQEFRGKAAYMQRAGGYEILFHEMWAQPMSGPADALPIVVDTSGDAGLWPRLQGSVTLHLSRYLHIATDLWLNTSGSYLSGNWNMPAAPQGPASVVIETAGATNLSEDNSEVSAPVYPYRHAVLLSQKRRMRSNEVHYIDHPMFGVIVKLMPLDDDALAALALAERDWPSLPPIR